MMQLMHKGSIISDVSCFIILTNIGELDVLHKVYGQITTTVEVASEYGEHLPDWVKIVTVTDKYKQQFFELYLDKGEASAIALALETPNSTIILDDRRARQIVHKLGLTYTGILGVVLKAKSRGIIHSVKPILEKIRQTNFRISSALELKVLKEANE